MHKLIAVCAVALAVAGSWAKPAAKQSALIHLEQIDHHNSIITTGVAVYPSDNPTVEFDRLVTPAIIPAARIRNSPGTLRLRWSNIFVIPFSGYVKVYEARYRYLKRVINGPDYYVDVTVFSNSDPIPVVIASGSTSAPIEIPLGNLPNFVVGGELQLKIELRGNLGSQLPGEPDSLAWGNRDVWNDFGAVYLTAQQPADIQAKPWTEVLEQACWFAQEQTAESDVRREVTKGIFFETKIYDFKNIHFIKSIVEGNIVIDLKDYFSPSTNYMDCKEGASLIVIMCESIGFPTVLRYFRGMFDPAKPEMLDHITTNLFCPAGSDPQLINNYLFIEFDHHCVAESEKFVYDGVAAQLFSPSGAFWMNPVWGWEPEVYAQSGLFGLINWPYLYPFHSLSYLRDVIGVL